MTSSAMNVSNKEKIGSLTIMYLNKKGLKEQNKYINQLQIDIDKSFGRVLK